MTLVTGMIIQTSYTAAHFEILSIYGPCDCSKYLDTLEFGDKAPKSKPHYHFTVKDLRPMMEGRDNTGYLNGYTLQGKSVWTDDKIFIINPNSVQGVLFQ